MPRKALIHDLNDWHRLPKRVRESVRRYKYCTLVGRVDISEKLCHFGRDETAFAKTLRKYEQERREALG